MPEWGYKINRDTSINLDKADRRLAMEIESAEPGVRTCIACGSCGGTCSAAQFTTFSFRKMILLIQRGVTQDIEKEIKKCLFCGKCSLVCPRGVNTRHILALIREHCLN
ncbi:MAG: 4Fe-4S dicluster domain-containing protein [Bacteroidales bacterium]